MLTAYCESCGFVQHGINFGVGFVQHTPNIPALQKGSEEIVVEEFKDDADLRFYHQPEMYKGVFKTWKNIDPDPVSGIFEGYGIQCGDIYLSPEKNLCPGCGKFTMQFVQVGNWD
jgi:hypothetical protein